MYECMKCCRLVKCVMCLIRSLRWVFAFASLVTRVPNYSHQFSVHHSRDSRGTGAREYQPHTHLHCRIYWRNDMNSDIRGCSQTPNKCLLINKTIYVDVCHVCHVCHVCIVKTMCKIYGVRILCVCKGSCICSMCM